MDSFVVRLPKYVFKAFAQEWLTCKDIVLLDSAIVSKGRTVVLNHIQNLQINVRVLPKHVTLCFRWLIKRKCYIVGLTISYSYSGSDPSVWIFPDFSKLKYFHDNGRGSVLLTQILCKEMPELTSIQASNLVDNFNRKAEANSFPPSVKDIRLCRYLKALDADKLQTLFKNVPLLTNLHIEEGGSYPIERLTAVLNTQHSIRKLTYRVEYGVENDLELIEIVKYCPLLEDLTIRSSIESLNIECLAQLKYLKRLSLRVIQKLVHTSEIISKTVEQLEVMSSAAVDAFRCFPCIHSVAIGNSYTHFGLALIVNNPNILRCLKSVDLSRTLSYATELDVHLTALKERGIQCILPSRS